MNPVEAELIQDAKNVVPITVERERQLHDRKKFIGGSDAAAVMGLAPATWDVSTPLDVWLQKTGRAPQQEDDDRRKQQKLFRRGRREEPFVIDDLAEDYGIKIVRRSTLEKPNRYIDQEHPFLAAEIDFEWEVTKDAVALVSESQPRLAALVRELVGTVQNGEVKTHHIFADTFGAEGTEETPIEYAAQAFHGQGVMTHLGRRLTMFGVRSSLDDLRVYWIARDDKIIRDMRARLVKFWRENILADKAPDPIRLNDILEMFKRAPNMRVQCTEEVYPLLLEMSTHKATAKVAGERIDELKFQLGKFMLGESAIRWERVDGEMKMVPTETTPTVTHELMWQGWPCLRVGLQQQNRISADKVRSKHPDIVPDVTKTIEFFKFDQPKAGGQSKRKK